MTRRSQPLKLWRKMFQAEGAAVTRAPVYLKNELAGGAGAQ